VYINSGVSLIRSQNVYNGQFQFEGLAYIDERQAKKMDGVEVQFGDVLLNITGDSVARACIVPEAVLPARVNQHVAIIRPDENILDSQFLAYFLITPRMQTSMLSLAGSGGTRNALTKAMIERFEVPSPDISVQRSVVKVIRAYDDLILNNRRRMQLLEEAARLLFREWFVEFRYPGHEHVDMINGMPKGWSRKSLREVCEAVDYGYTASADTEPIGPKFLRITDIVPDAIDWPSVPHCAIDEARLTKVALLEGDIVVARTGATVGYAKRLHKRHPQAVFASYLVRLRLGPDLDNLIAGIFIESDAYKKFVLSRVGGAAQPNANAQVLASADIVVPPPPVQRAFRESVEAIFDLREILQDQIQRLREARDLLLPRLMSGEVEV
jgi:type I restriction enzyme S subunit